MATTGALIPEVERALVRAVSLNVPADRRRRRRRVGVLSCAAVLVVGATAIAATSWLPELGNDQLGHPSASQSPAPSAQSGHLAVLRSPQTEGDRSTDVEDAFRVIGSHELDGVRLDDVRVLHRGTAGLAVLVPVERSGSHDSGHPSTEVEDSLCVLFSASPPASANRRATGVVGQKCGSGADLLDGKIGLRQSRGRRSVPRARACTGRGRNRRARSRQRADNRGWCRTQLLQHRGRRPSEHVRYEDQMA